MKHLLTLTLLSLLLASCTTPEPKLSTNQYGEVVEKIDDTTTEQVNDTIAFNPIYNHSEIK